MPRISRKSQITLPVEALARAGLKAGDEVTIGAEGPTWSSCAVPRGARVSGCVLDTDVEIAALDQADAHHDVRDAGTLRAAVGALEALGVELHTPTRADRP